MSKTWLFLLCLISYTAHAANTLSMTQVAPGIYVHFGVTELPDQNNHNEIANIGFIIGQDCVAVIDTGGNPEQGQALKQALQKTTDKPICYVINTHVHPDHIYGNSAFKNPSVKFIGHHKLARAIATRSAYYIDKAQDQLNIKLTPADLIAPDIEVKQTLTISLGNRDLILTAHPTAHTDNDLSVYDAQTDTLWLSDLLFVTHLPVIDGSVLGWLKELEKLSKNHYKTVIPGHGAVVKDWPLSLKPQKTYLQNLVTDVRSLLKQGKYLEDAVTLLGRSLPSHWALVNEFHKKNITSTFAELEWDESN